MINDYQNFRFLFPFSDQLGKIANAYSLGSIWCWSVSWQCIRLAQLHSDAVDFQKRDICFMRKLCMIQIMRILDSSSMP